MKMLIDVSGLASDWLNVSTFFIVQTAADDKTVNKRLKFPVIICQGRTWGSWGVVGGAAPATSGNALATCNSKNCTENPKTE